MKKYFKSLGYYILNLEKSCYAL